LSIKIYLTAAGAVQPAANNNDTATYFRNRSLVAQWHQYKVDSLLFDLDLMVYDNNKNYSSYEKTALQFTEKYHWNDYSDLNHIADIFLRQVTNPSSLNRLQNGPGALQSFMPNMATHCYTPGCWKNRAMLQVRKKRRKKRSP
jgi:hypothetical protein